MSKRPDTKNSYTVFLIDATEDQIAQIREKMPGWLWLEAPEDLPFDLEDELVDLSLDAVIVFAHRNKEARALDLCRRIREQKGLAGVPLLVAASRYQIAIGYEMRRLGLGEFILTPIDENGLAAKIKESKSVSS
jgi:response regulator RpfG family c-di-GMP phosphodiesterase